MHPPAVLPLLHRLDLLVGIHDDVAVQEGELVLGNDHVDLPLGVVVAPHDSHLAVLPLPERVRRANHAHGVPHVDARVLHAQADDDRVLVHPAHDSRLDAFLGAAGVAKDDVGEGLARHDRPRPVPPRVVDLNLRGVPDRAAGQVEQAPAAGAGLGDGVVAVVVVHHHVAVAEDGGGRGVGLELEGDVEPPVVVSDVGHARALPLSRGAAGVRDRRVLDLPERREVPHEHHVLAEARAVVDAKLEERLDRGVRAPPQRHALHRGLGGERLDDPADPAVLALRRQLEVGDAAHAVAVEASCPRRRGNRGRGYKKEESGGCHLCKNPPKITQSQACVRSWPPSVFCLPPSRRGKEV
mmetsp:Transcript_771/g.2053  ORF Transcript_771/g.2053 Transcript_771/m.2053 type:complete len:354 (+) Transcript_771:2559-3620(+)